MLKPVQIIRRSFPITSWLPEYTFQKAICDVIAGITVGLTLIPQSIAYAALAGLSPEFGLYSSLCGGFIYTIFGTVKDLNIAPTALISLLTYSYTHESPFGDVSAAVLLCFISGILEIACGILHLGFLVDFVSTPVVAGFTSAGALTIAAAQIKNMLGLKFKAETFVKTIYNVFLNIGKTSLWDAVLSLCCCTLLIGLRELKRFGKPPPLDKGKSEKFTYRTLLWFVSVSRNAFVVVLCATMAYIFKLHDLKPFSLTDAVPQGLPHFYIPFIISNGTEQINIFEAVKSLGTGIFVVPLVSILSNIAIAKAFAEGKVLDASQEMLAVGLCNMFGSYLGSFPVNASFSRAAVNNASGARTTFGGIYTGALVMLALTFLTPYFSFIPKATLSSVIICAVIYMVEVNLSKMIWKINKIDFFPLVVTILACLALSIEIGIVIGILVDLLLVLYYTARPKIEMENVKHVKNFTYLRVTLVGSLFYSAAEYTRDRIIKNYLDYESVCKYVVFDCSKLRKIDFTAAKCLDALVNDLTKKESVIVFLRSKETINNLLKKSISKTCHFIKSEDELEYLFDEKENLHHIASIENHCINAGFEGDTISMHEKL